MSDNLKVAKECGAEVIGTSDTYVSVKLNGHFVFSPDDLIAFARAIADLQKANDGDALSDALQSDLEHGARILNEKAAKEFHENYPALTAAIEKINSTETNIGQPA